MAVVVAAVIGVLAVGAVTLLGGDDLSSGPADDATPDSAEAATTTLALFGAPVPTTTMPAAAVEPPPAPETTFAAPPATLAETAPENPPDATPETTIATSPAPTTTAAPPAQDVPESKAVVRGGQIFLEGAIPNAAVGEEIVALAAEILGPDNVFNNYVIDERAGDPNLGNITVEDTINFATGSSVILPESEGLLNQGLALLGLRPAMTITIVGHTDDRGSDESNLVLSQDRADAVKKWFTDRDIDPARLTAEGRGEAAPIADNSTIEGRQLNRRIQFFLENILGGA